jgi:hypothetical protein
MRDDESGLASRKKKKEKYKKKKKTVRNLCKCNASHGMWVCGLQGGCMFFFFFPPTHLADPLFLLAALLAGPARRCRGAKERRDGVPAKERCARAGVGLGFGGGVARGAVVVGVHVSGDRGSYMYIFGGVVVDLV